MLLLSVDSSSVKASLSIAKLKKNTFDCLSHQEWLSEPKKNQAHSSVITIYLQKALKESGINLKDLNLIICGVGPGSFTGIRVSINFAKALAFSLNIKLVAVSSLESLAKQSKQLIKTKGDKEAVLPLIHAFSKKIYLSAYFLNTLNPILQKQVIDYEALEVLLSLQNISIWHISGDAYPLFEKYFSDKIKKTFKIYSKVIYPSSLDMLNIFLDKAEKNTLDWKTLMPLYIRSSSAEELLIAKK